MGSTEGQSLNILIILPHWLGDAVLATSVIHTCIQENPESVITVACRADFVDLISGCPQIRHCIPVDRTSKKRRWFSVWRQTVVQKWSQVIDLRGTGLGFFLRAQDRKIWKRPGACEHRVKHYQAFMRSPLSHGPRLWIHPDLLEKTERQTFSEHGMIILAPTANSPHKEWGQHQFQDLMARWLSSSPTLKYYTFLVVGTLAERPRVADFLSFLKDEKKLSVIDAVGGYSIGTLAALFSRACFFLGNDSGPMHIAAVLGVPAVSLFGPTSETIYGPWNLQQDHEKTCSWVVRAPGSIPEHTKNMETLTVSYVHQRIEEIWASLNAH